ncbi:hypothetical protein D3C72_1163230 [compost metagenome]
MKALEILHWQRIALQVHGTAQLQRGLKQGCRQFGYLVVAKVGEHQQATPLQAPGQRRHLHPVQTQDPQAGQPLEL